MHHKNKYRNIKRHSFFKRPKVKFTMINVKIKSKDQRFWQTLWLCYMFLLSHGTENLCFCLFYHSEQSIEGMFHCVWVSHLSYKHKIKIAMIYDTQELYTKRRLNYNITMWKTLRKPSSPWWEENIILFLSDKIKTQTIEKWGT